LKNNFFRETLAITRFRAESGGAFSLSLGSAGRFRVFLWGMMIFLRFGVRGYYIMGRRSQKGVWDGK
jgi:hypothetical protein